MKKYLFLMAGLIIAFQACKKADNNNNNSTTTKPAAVPCFTSAHTIIDSNEVDTFNASCSQNASSYSWLSLSDGGKGGNTETWTKYFINRSSTANGIQLSVTGPDGNTKTTTNNVICGFQQYRSITITKLPAGFKDSFYLTCSPIAGSAPRTATVAVSSLPITVALDTFVSVNQTANHNTGKWVVRIEDVQNFSPVASFTFYPGAIIASPYARTTIPIASLSGTSSINLNYIIAQN